ncbi:MAG: SDR family NAD(P)-dependent oxidoreductase [Alphaproteobacteria bacterium]
MGQVDGKVALVSGGASGIGQATCEILAREGAAVVVADVDDAGAAKVADGIAKAGGRAKAVHLDVTDEQQWVDAVGATLDAFGRLDVLVNNAGICVNCPITEMSLAEWRRQQAINVDGVFLGTKHAIPAMRRGGRGVIINISSVAGLVGSSAGLAAYTATKGAVRLFTKSTALECAANGDDIRCNSVHPGIIITPLWGKMFPDDPSFQMGSNDLDPAKRMKRNIPVGRSGSPQDIANGILFLSSDASSYMNGAELVIDGGVTAA